MRICDLAKGQTLPNGALVDTLAVSNSNGGDIGANGTANGTGNDMDWRTERQVMSFSTQWDQRATSQASQSSQDHTHDYTYNTHSKQSEINKPQHAEQPQPQPQQQQQQQLHAVVGRKERQVTSIVAEQASYCWDGAKQARLLCRPFGWGLRITSHKKRRPATIVTTSTTPTTAATAGTGQATAAAATAAAEYWQNTLRLSLAPVGLQADQQVRGGDDIISGERKRYRNT